MGASKRYTDALAERLAAAHLPPGVANAGITGNLLLSQLPCFGEKGVARFQRDALSQPGVRAVIVEEGTNDIWDSQANHNCGTEMGRGYFAWPVPTGSPLGELLSSQ